MCTVAAIIAALGYMPPKGTVIIVPKSATAQYTAAQQWQAKRCARKFGIEWRVDEGS